MEDFLQNISIDDDAIILEPIAIDEYYKETSNFAISKDKNYEIGRVLKVGTKVPQDKIGQDCFFHKGIGTLIELRNRKKIVLISQPSVLIFIK